MKPQAYDHWLLEVLGYDGQWHRISTLRSKEAAKRLLKEMQRAYPDSQYRITPRPKKRPIRA